MTSNSQLHTIEFYSAVINHISEMVVGVEKIVGIYNIEDGTNKLFGTCLSLLNNQLTEQELIIDDDIVSLQQLQREKIQYKWLNKSQIPFEENQINSGQLNIFNEYNNLILLVSIPQFNSNKRNLVFVYFRDELDQFGVHHEKSKLSTQNKTIIGHLVSKSVISLSKIYWIQDSKMKRFAKKTQEVIQFQKKSNENSENNQGLENLIIGWATDLIEKYRKSDGFNYVYQSEALEKIIKYKGPFSDLKKAIHEAIEYAKMLNSYSDSNQIIIEADYISEFNIVNIQNVTCDNAVLPERLQKTQQLLDKLERYALKISNEGIKLTSSNVGRSMDNPITAAAISDSISKNKDRINTLFKQFPDKWGFIKNNFKPIINITSKDNYQSRKWG